MLDLFYRGARTSLGVTLKILGFLCGICGNCGICERCGIGDIAPPSSILYPIYVDLFWRSFDFSVAFLAFVAGEYCNTTPRQNCSEYL